ncbi:AraC family transcriptional regulator [Asaia sp. VD9]|uniref:helix-turn-helix domain-containing protein n=1 Tax=Asaia sp. VD9 TaxID=3081235 RepID=UPI0030158F19
MVKAGHLVSASTDARWLIPAGQAYWVPPAMPHGGALCAADGIKVYISTDLSRDFCPPVPLAFSVTPLLCAIMERWAEEASLGLPDRPLDRHRLALVSDEMTRAVTRPLILPMPAHVIMRAVMSEWARESEEQLSLDALAQRCRMSRRSFTRRFRSETGMAPGAWMQCARILRGCALMSEGISITETAYRLGYESPSSFFNLCRKMTGLSPSALFRSIDQGDA